MPFRLDRLQFVRYTADHTAVLDQLVGTLHQLVNGGVLRDGLVELVERDEKKIALGLVMAALLDHAGKPERDFELEKSIKRELYVDKKSGILAQGCMTTLVLISCGIIAGGIFWLFGFGKWSAGFTAVILLYFLVKAYPMIREVKTKK
jgi:hypothetical protein